jgi:outer membrane protein OmpA-like peptidoglycan-associated protein
MTHHALLAMTVIAAAVAASCSSMPADNARLDAARSEYRIAQNNPDARDLASSEMKHASDALAKANDAWTRNADSATVDQLAYLASQRVAIAQQTGSQKAADAALVNANADRDKARLAARTSEADDAKRSAETAQRSAESAQRDAQASQRQAAASSQQASDTQARNRELQAQLTDLNAKATDRGLVVTIGDVLFDTNKAQLSSGGQRSVQKLGDFLKQNPQRKALIEGFTDSVGSDETNQELSGRRADAVRTLLVGMGVGMERIATHAYGEAFPVAGNDSAAGRQMNRRVEVVLSDDKGSIAPR